MGTRPHGSMNLVIKVLVTLLFGVAVISTALIGTILVVRWPQRLIAPRYRKAGQEQLWASQNLNELP